MADQDNPTTDIDLGAEATDAATAPQASTVAQYIKDLSAESPSAPQVFQWQEQPTLDVQFGINGGKVADDVHEVILKIEVSAKSDSGTHFIVDLSYAGLFAFRNIAEDALAPFLLVEAPRLLFPFARQIVADAIQNLGFPPLLLDPIDFGAAYMSQMDAQGQAQGQPGGDGEPPVGHA
ncbi:protein-export chaperone SecB [Sphingomonas sp. LY29]|uniref:protein-export chaperone SecB n=1 Tax=Sphingomonas sp. LY29 TaxID=3095341 RepID=UPI002D78FA8E|nr:protein-export chaperone SecB [Sphingomonas sp. LY29]WRP25880.1 protein-export chaperone SecB [Sphingomonas sp. LY29]